MYSNSQIDFGTEDGSYASPDVVAQAGDMIGDSEHDSESVGMYISKGNNYSGNIVTRGGTISYGVSAGYTGQYGGSPRNIYGGTFTALGGHATQSTDRSIGYNSELSLNVYGGEFFAQGEKYGIRNNSNNKHVVVSVKDTAEKATFIGGTSAAISTGSKTLTFNNNLPGDGYTNIEGTEGHVVIAAQEGEEKQTLDTSLKNIEFKGISASATAPSAVTYDGSAHECINDVVVTYPTSGTTVSYSLDGTNYSDTKPLVTEAGVHKVYYKVSAEGFADHIGFVKFTVNNAELTGVSVTSNADLVYTGSDLTPVVTTAGKGVDNLSPAFTYSLTESDYGEMPKVKELGEHTIYYKASLANHNDYLGSFTVKVVKGSEPTPGGGSAKAGLPAGAVVGIVLGGVVLSLGIAYALLMFVFNKWIKEGDKVVRVLRFALGTKDGKQRYLAFPCKFAYKNKEEIFDTKKGAEDYLNKSKK